MAGKYYLEKQGKSLGIPEEELLKTAAVSLGLNDVSEFNPQKKIIEYQFKEFENSLIELNLREFANELSSDSPAPGGGSTAALCGSLSASLSAMVSNLTVGKNGYEEVQDKVKSLAESGQGIKDDLLRAIDQDTQAFNQVMAAFRLNRKTKEQKAIRIATIEDATKEATLIPFEVMEKCVTALKLAKEVALTGNKNSISDAGVAGLTAQAGAEGAYYNVMINLPNINDKEFKSDISTKAISLKDDAVKLGNEIREIIEKALLE